MERDGEHFESFVMDNDFFVCIYLFICFSRTRKAKISIKLLFFGVLKQRFVTKTWVSFLFKQKMDCSLNCPGQWFSLSVKVKI